MHRFALPLVLSIVVILGACSSPGGASPTTTGGEATRIEVGAREFAFDPSELTVKPGTVTFAVRNTGEIEHEFEILQGDDVIDEVEGLVPGLQRDLTVELAAGAYRYVCRLAGHEEAGMTGTLTVAD